MLDAENRTWTINDSALDAVSDDLNAIINCTHEDDVVLFDVENEIRPRTRIIIPWNLTLSAAAACLGVDDGIFAAADRKTTFVCPQTDGIFRIKAKNALLANLVFEDCSLDAKRGSIIDVGECTARNDRGTINLYHVAFRRNVLHGASALSASNSPCRSVELVNVDFSDNSCGAACFASLSSKNNLRNVIMQGNIGFPRRESQSLILAPPASDTPVVKMEALANDVPVIRVSGGKLKLKNSEFKEHFGHPTVLLEKTTQAVVADCVFSGNFAFLSGTGIMANGTKQLDISNCTFLSNSARSGAAVAVVGGNATIDRCRFMHNIASEHAGALFIKNGSVELQSSHFENNTAAANGGAVLLEANTASMISNVSCHNNTAGGYGGCLHVTASSRVVVRRSFLTGNVANNGGAVSFAVVSASEIMDTVVGGNVGNKNGGGVLLTNSIEIELTGCMITNNTAEVGGGLSSQGSRNVTSHRCLLKENKVSKEGAGAQVEQGSSVLSVETNWTANSAGLYGGGLNVKESNFTSQASTYSDNQASEGAAAVFDGADAVSLEGDSITRNTAHGGSGAGITAHDVKITLKNGYIGQNKAIHGSGFILMNTDGNIENTTFVENESFLYGGGLFCIASNVTLLHLWFMSNKGHHHSGAIGFARSSVTARNLTIRDNLSGQHGAGISITHTSVVNISDSILVNNSANLDGALSISSSNVRVTGTSIRQHQAREGAAVGLRDGNLLLESSVVESNQAQKDGGAIYAVAGVFEARNVIFFNNTAARNGESLSGIESSSFTFVNCSFSDNQSNSGGSFCIQSNSSVNISSSYFENNRATQDGGGGFLDNSIMTAQKSIFRNNDGKVGGSVSSRNSTLRLMAVMFENDKASLSGGSISATEQSSVELINTSFSNCSAATGGAIWLSEAALKASDLGMRMCDAVVDGGGMLVNASSTLLCSQCAFSSNIAGNHGGAIAFDSPAPQLLALQLNNCSFSSNRGNLGGAVHVSTRQDPEGCSGMNASCAVVVATGNSFLMNNAKTAGGAIFLEDPSVLRYSCTARGPEALSTSLGIETVQFLASLTSVQDMCPTWKGNDARGYGPNVGTYARSARVFNPDDEARASKTPNEGHRLVFKNQRGGDPLPPIFVEVLDGFGQGPPLGGGDRHVEAIISSPNVSFIGDVTTLLDQMRKELPVTYSLQPPGYYVVAVNFTEPALSSIIIEVEFRGCEIGESVKENGNLCSKCSDTQYNFDATAAKCAPCPLEGNCTSNAIVPIMGYWHRTPCSRRIQKCTSKDACDFSERDKDLFDAVKDMRSCRLNKALDKLYAEAQCKKGYTGILCGSCDVRYGRSPALNCLECGHDAETISLFVVSMILLLLLSAFTIRSNLKARKPGCSRINRGGKMRSLRTFRNSGCILRRESSVDVPVNFQMVEMLHTGHVPPEIVHPDLLLMTTSMSPKKTDPVHIKSQIVEIFKVTINFLQAIGAAVAVNANWTAWMYCILSAADFFSGAAMQGITLRIDCLFDPDHYPPRSILRTVIYLAIPPGVLAFYVVFWAFKAYRTRENISYFVNTMALSALAVMYLTHVPITKTAVDTLHCIEAHDSTDVDHDHTDRYWAMDTSLKCYEGSHAVIASVIGWPVVTIFSFGLPIALAYGLLKLDRRCMEHDDKTWFSQASGFLYRAYKERFVFWESVIMLRKGILIVVVAFSYPLGTNLQGIIAVCLLMFATYIQVMCRPYNEDFDSLNTYETSSLFVSCFTFASGLFFNDERTSDAVRVLLTIILSGAICGLFLLLVYKLLKCTEAYVKIALVDEGIEEATQWGLYRSMRVYIFMNIAAFFGDLSKP